MGHKPWDRPWKRREKARLKRYAQQLADDGEFQAKVERIEAVLASGDEQAIKEMLGEPVDLESLRKKYVEGVD